MIPFDDSGVFRPSREGEGLRRAAVRGAAATVSAQALALAAQVISTVVLARLLTPRDFGVVAMVTTFSLVLMSFGPNGFNELVIQRDQIDHSQASNLFWINFTVGLMLAIGFASAGSLLARFYRDPLVTRVAFGISPAIFISAISVIHLALIRRAMRFGAAAANEVVGRLVNTLVAVLMAFRGWGYWALVAGIVAQALSMTIGGWWLCRWVPSLPRRGAGTGSMLRFAMSVYGRFSANYFARNFDNILVGWRFDAAALGYYKKAYDLFALSASQVTAPLHNVALAALSRLNQDPIRFRRYLANSLGIIAMVGMAMSADLTLVGRDLVRLVLGPKWADSGRIFVLFGPGIGLMLLTSTVGWIHLSIGKPERWLRWTMVETVATALSFVAALPWGPAGVAVAWTVSFWILAIPAFWYAGRPIGFSTSDFLAAIWRYIAASVVAGFACAIVVQHLIAFSVATSSAEALQLLLVKSVLFTILYLVAVVLLYRGFEPLIRISGLLRELVPRTDRARAVAITDRDLTSNECSEDIAIGRGVNE
jgi:O-antigen/teichoic acid export membrane protein